MATRTRLNYVDPEKAPPHPESPLPIRLGGGRDQGEEVENDVTVSVGKVIHNGRAHPFVLERDGFEMLSKVSLSLSEQDYSDRRKRYYGVKAAVVPLAIHLAKTRFGCEPFAWQFFVPYVRQASPNPHSSTTLNRDHDNGSKPHAMVHNDFGFGYDEYLRNLPPEGMFGFKKEQKQKEVEQHIRRAGRFLVLQFWMPAQPAGTVIENDTLALCHPRSIREQDLVTRPLEEYDGYKVYAASGKDGETSNAKKFTVVHAKASPFHEWYYWPNLVSGDEALVWVGYDSDWGSNHLKPCLHTSIHYHSKPSQRPRQSIECRILLFLDPKSNSEEATTPLRSML